MSEGLKALAKVKEALYLMLGDNCKEVDIIENELKELEEHEEILNSYNLTLANFREACLLLAQWKSAHLSWADYDKELRVLDIIRKNNIIIPIKGRDNRYWLESQMLDAKRISRKEYELLKEVL